jgi:hypothetical protein
VPLAVQAHQGMPTRLAGLGSTGGQPALGGSAGALLQPCRPQDVQTGATGACQSVHNKLQWHCRSAKAENLQTARHARGRYRWVLACAQTTAMAVLVRCCSPADRKTCKRALHVGVCLSSNNCSAHCSSTFVWVSWARASRAVGLRRQYVTHSQCVSQCVDVLLDALTAICQHVLGACAKTTATPDASDVPLALLEYSSRVIPSHVDP